MTESSNNKNFNAADFERYHAGKMSAAEMHAIEKAAMEDPFLADALEGYAFAATPQQDLENLREKTFGKKTGGKAVPFIGENYSWLRVAAIVVFIAAGAWLAVQLINTGKKELAEQTTQEKQEAQDSVQRQEIVQTPAVQTDSLNDKASQGYDFRTRTDSKHITFKNKSTGNFTTFWSDSTATPVESKDGLAINDTRRQGDSTLYKTASDGTLATTGYGTNRNYSNVNAANATSTMPLPGYNNSYPPRSRKDSSEALAFTKERPAAATDTINNLQIVLQPDNTGVSEVVVSAGKKQETASRKFELKVDTLEPKEGWAKFDDYIASNIQIPEELKSKQPYAGEVELSFEVDKNGEPVNITVTRSLCNKCDEEAIRLLKEGPKWKKKKSKKGTVTIKF
jgi:Gram-negative bacterial TonB protein C-terminal